jgi:hypothetical protein
VVLKNRRRIESVGGSEVVSLGYQVLTICLQKGGLMMSLTRLLYWRAPYVRHEVAIADMTDYGLHRTVGIK